MEGLLSWERFVTSVPAVLDCLPVTLQMLAFAEIIGIAGGAVVALCRLRSVPVVKEILVVYTSFMRGTPVIVQMLVVLYGLPMVISLFGVDINRWDKLNFVILALGLNEVAFLGEIFRSSIAAISPAQFEAGLSCGLSWWQTFRRVVCPQAVRVALPAYGQNLVGLLQSTSIAYMLGVMDMMAKAQYIGQATRHSLEAYLIVALVYVAFSLALRATFALASRRLDRAY